jgi:hypothetical protein
MSFPAKEGLKKFPAERYWVNWGSCCANTDPDTNSPRINPIALKNLTHSFFLLILDAEFPNLN